MALRYYPKNRIKPNQYTSGGQLIINGEDYKGHYYETFDGRIFSGRTPTDRGANKPLVRRVSVADGAVAPKNLGAAMYSEGPEANLTYLVPFYPTPTPDDYAKGFFVRYFARKVNGAKEVIEISEEKFKLMKGQKAALEDYLYQVTDLFWKLTGPLHDDRVNKQYPVAGIIDTNKRLVEFKEKEFTGLKTYIGENYTKFSRPS